MLKAIKLKFGSSPSQKSEEITLTPLTVFIGPNNSGKSKILSEIKDACSGTNTSIMKILENIEPEFLPKEFLDKLIEQRTIPDTQPNPNPDSLVLRGSELNSHLMTSRSYIQNIIDNPSSNPESYRSMVLGPETLMLNGINRLSLVNTQNAGDLQLPPTSTLMSLLKNKEKRKKVRNITKDAFGKYLVIDPTNLGMLRAKLADHEIEEEIELGLSRESINYHSQSQPIDTASDGVRAYTGVIVELIAGDPQIILIDEPEAFLHPALASKLGSNISQIISATSKKVFASTHSQNFLMGCIQSGQPLNIIRLTYKDGVATSRCLKSDELLELMRNPLLRSSGVLSGLFYESVVITESDADRAFYQEINERLLRFKPEWGIPNCLFINAQNKQTIPTLLKPLRDLGIPVSGIFDIDILKEGGSVWKNLLKCGYIPEASHDSYASLRTSIKKSFDQTGKDMKRDGGIDILEGSDRETVENLFQQLGEYGLFVIPGGELESWLKDHNISGHGPTWLIRMFEAMGNNPEHSNYTKPTEQDIWQFISRMSTWHLNAKRKGIPT
ncbi:ATP-dependent endonuclease [Pseudomonas sp. NBRC 111142]|uniref:ATP-dependent nuclease n=2 Tax=Pseudomonas TaxID=286 RepID=UPI0009EC38DD|nr:AAA family ATPase [Pseudomonas sp. NBRC 111142]